MRPSHNAQRPDSQEASTRIAGAVGLFTVDEVARQLNVSRSKIYGLIARGDLTVHRLPAIRVSQDDIQEFLAGCRSQRSRPNGPRPSMVQLKHLR